MLNIERTRELLADLNLPENNVEDIHAVCAMLAELAFDSWDEQRKKQCQTNSKTELTGSSSA